MKSNFLVSRVLAICALLAGTGVLIGSGGARLMADAATSWGFDTANMDKTCKPCEDFYQYAMGGWMKNNPIPPDYALWGSFSQLQDKNQTVLRQIAEDSGKARAAAGSNEQKVGDLYATCMDTGAIEAAGLKPLAPEFSAIDAMQ